MQTRTLLSLCGLAAALTALPTAHAVPKYAKLIPNGSGVAGVTALGHTDPESGGATNAFGKAFAAAGNAWTEALCKADSDGDGQTNGEELGDPCCKWTSGGTPAVPSGAKDPGSATSKLDDAALASAKALCGGAAPAASSAAPAADPGTVKPADGASNATPALTPGAPAATPAAGATPAAATPATPGAATAGSDGYDWVPIEEMNKTTASSKAGSTATTPSASSSASSATNSSQNTTSAAVSPNAQRGASVLQVVAAAVVGAVALAL